MVDRIADSLYIIQMMLSLFWPSLTAHPFPLPSMTPPPPHPYPIHTYRTVMTTTTTLIGKERNDWTRGQSSDENHMIRRWISLRPNIWNPTTCHILFCALHNDEQWQQIRLTLLRNNRADERPKFGRESHDVTVANITHVLIILLNSRVCGTRRVRRESLALRISHTYANHKNVCGMKRVNRDPWCCKYHT